MKPRAQAVERDLFMTVAWAPSAMSSWACRTPVGIFHMFLPEMSAVRARVAKQAGLQSVCRAARHAARLA